MTALPAKTAFTDSTVTEGTFKSSLDDQRDFLAEQLGTVGGDVSGSILRQSRNLLLGADFSRAPWQRGETLTVTATNTYGPDRWCVEFDGTATISMDKVALATPQKFMGRWCTHGVKVTVDAKSGLSYLRLIQRVEDVSSIVDQSSYLQTAIQGSGTFSVPVQLRQSFGTGGGASTAVVTAFDAALSVTASMQVLNSGLTVPTIASKAIGADGLHTSYAAVEYDLAAVPVAGYVIIPLVQYEAGSNGTLFDYRDNDQVLDDCQRYYEKSYDLGVAPGVVTTSGRFHTTASSSGGVRQSVEFKTRKRIAQHSPQVYSTVTGASGKIDDTVSDYTATVTANGQAGFYVSADISASSSARFQWVSDSEIY